MVVRLLARPTVFVEVLVRQSVRGACFRALWQGRQTALGVITKARTSRAPRVRMNRRRRAPSEPPHPRATVRPYPSAALISIVSLTRHLLHEVIPNTVGVSAAAGES